MTEDRGEDAVRVARVHEDLGDLLAVPQAEVAPGAAGVGGLVDAVADGEVGALEPLAAADEEDVRIGRRHRDGADGAGGRIVEDRGPDAAVVGGPPDAAVVDAEVEEPRPARHPHGADGPAAAEGTDEAPAELGVETEVHLLGTGERGHVCSKQCEHEQVMGESHLQLRGGCDDPPKLHRGRRVAKREPSYGRRIDVPGQRNHHCLVYFRIVGSIAGSETIARGKAIREIDRLRRLYGTARWRKRKGIARVELPNGAVRLAEVHWYEATGIGKRECKIKRYLD